MPEKIHVPEAHWDAMFAPSSVLTMITSISPDGNINAATFGTCTRVSHDPMYVLFAVTATPPSDTYTNVLATGQFVVNPVPFERDLLERARTVGLPFAAGINELDRAGLTAVPSLAVAPPRIAECRSHFECEVAWVQTFEHRAIICGKVVAVTIDEDCYDPRGIVRFENLKPSHYCGAPYDGNFVPAYQPTFVSRPYDGPRDWRAGIPDVDEIPDIFTSDEEVRFGGAGAAPSRDRDQ